MWHSSSTGSAVPFRLQAYVETIVHTCSDGGRALVSVVLFGSAAIGGWVETVSDVDLILVVPDSATDEDTDRLRSEVERIGILHRLRTRSAHDQPALERLLDRVTANARSFFICTRGELLSGNIGRILRLHPSQTIFVDRVVLANIVNSGITVWGEAMLPLIPVAPIRRFDVFKATHAAPFALPRFPHQCLRLKVDRDGLASRFPKISASHSGARWCSKTSRGCCFAERPFARALAASTAICSSGNSIVSDVMRTCPD
jgi:predicted nucleotidyltransferase